MTPISRQTTRSVLSRNRALYFPYINVPSDAWFTRLLLYWDKIGSIVPYEYIARPDKLSPYMRVLVEAGLVEQIIPREHIHSIPHFAESFLDYINKHREALLRDKPGQSVARVQLHIEKLGDLSNRLVRMGFARSIGSSWYEVRASVARPFMAYLATALGALRDVGAAPITNDRESLRLLGGFVPTQARSRLRQKVRTIILEDILPAPDRTISIADIVRFKARYGQQLNRFRRRIEAKCTELSYIANQSDLEELVAAFTGNIKDEIQDIAEKMKTKWPNVVFSGLFSVLGTGGSLIGIQSGNYQALAFGGLSLVAAVHQAFGLSREQRGIFQNPLAYAVLAQRKFQIRSTRKM